MGVHELATEELMNLYGDLLNELNDRGVVRTYNSPVGDYAEWLVAKTLGLELANNSTKGYDALDTVNKGVRYQVKSRWENRGRGGKQLNVIRKYEDYEFDYLIVVYFDSAFNVKEAYKIPHAKISEYAKYSTHQNGYILAVKGKMLEDPCVVNITKLFKKESNLNNR